MQIIYNTALVAGLASTTAAQASSESACNTFSTTLTSTIATVTVTVSSGAEASPPSASTTTITSGSCASVSSYAVFTTPTTESVAPSTTAWALSASQCVFGNQTVGVNTVSGLNGTAYLVCPGVAPFPTLSTIASSVTADAIGAQRNSSSFAFFPTGTANSTVFATATGHPTGVLPHPTSIAAAPTASIIPFAAGAAALDAKKALAALAGIAVGMMLL